MENTDIIGMAEFKKKLHEAIDNSWDFKLLIKLAKLLLNENLKYIGETLFQKNS